MKKETRQTGTLEAERSKHNRPTTSREKEQIHEKEESERRIEINEKLLSRLCHKSKENLESHVNNSKNVMRTLKEITVV